MKEIDIKTINDNFVEEIGNKNAIACARIGDSFNMCSIGWGTIGVLWSMPVMIIYVKPIRYTSKFLDNDDYFTVTFFNDDINHKVISICGTYSGKDVNKVEKAGLKPIILENGIIFENYRRVYVCKKIYQDQFKKENFIDGDKIINNYYLKEQPHNVYIGKIIKVLEP